jgi:hypothetical protein
LKCSAGAAAFCGRAVDSLALPTGAQGTEIERDRSMIATGERGRAIPSASRILSKNNGEPRLSAELAFRLLKDC